MASNVPRRVRRIWSLVAQRPAILGELSRAVFELAIARVRFGLTDVSSLLSSAVNSRSGTEYLRLLPAEIVLAERVGFAIRSAGPAMPFRADCLIQALAAQRWLRAQRIASAIQIGTRTDGEMKFEAHAWLVAGGHIITGGDVSGYQPLFGPDGHSSASRSM